MTRAVVVALSQGKQTLIDREDSERVNQYKWSFGSGYARRVVQVNLIQKTIYLHRFILNAFGEKDVDHINGDKLDNRKENLRLCNQTQNSGNMKKHGKYKYKGITYSNGKRIKRWEAQIMLKGKKRKFLGRYLTPEEAAQAYNEAAKQYFGEFARLNQI